jgi:hypothetical protein
MANDRLFKKLCLCKPMSTGLAGNPKNRREKDVKEYLRFTKINNRIKCIQDGVKCKKVFVKAKTLKQLICSA